MPSTMPSEKPSISTQPSSQPSETPSANPSQGCDNMRTDCGWGIFNPWTCQCDCPAGICLDDNQQCYTPCQETINVNPFAGCAPGWDCPWFPDHESGFCKSELHQPNEFEIYRTAKECCDEHYGGSADCNTKAKTVGEGHAPFPWPIHFTGTPEYRPFQPPAAENWWGTEAGNHAKWFPDLINKQNCVFGDNYEDFMSEDGFSDEYLFGTSANCCEKWYPHLGANCPASGGAVNGEAEDEPWMSNPYSMSNYYFPDFSQNSCGFGRDYPSWMGINGYEKHYLFLDGDDCCDRFFKGSGVACPFEHTYDPGYYWESYQNDFYNDSPMPIIYNHTFYPLIESGTCINGTDYPEWMGLDDDFSRMYLFKTLDGCCNKWFTDWGFQECKDHVVQGHYNKTYCPENRPILSEDGTGCEETENAVNTKWYPDLDANICKSDGDNPSWMVSADYIDYYIFTTKEACCGGFGYNC
ncbi:hypothetical protein THAOC_33163 [Thalassiosira oceanica]|uniref:Uncharacterized protein n=1 Tax=Thalassiosira oceanica TaxID=159749 RepID=K0R5N9_THAOC|nr:hypothetical protein THAOC_33163 [Thalassiosira oceanica]|eukprot:EJK48070.1 hypothetical protein THAOC_33163 [Thalassiosira oceanica]